MASLFSSSAEPASSGLSSPENRKVLMFMVIGIAVSFVVAYILYWIINKTISQQQSYLIPESKIPLDVRSANPVHFSGSKIPPSGNGYRSSTSFWIFINDATVNSGSMIRHVLHRGKQSDLPGTANPYIHLDPVSNKMYVTYTATTIGNTFSSTVNGSAVDYTQSGSSAPAGNGPLNASGTAVQAGGTQTPAEIAFMNAVRGIQIPYIPLQRWVHVAIVVNEDAIIGGSISAYVDAELVNTVTSSSTLPVLYNNKTTLNPTPVALTPPPVFNITDVNLDYQGDVYLGGAIGSPLGPGFSGMLSMISFYNYDLNANDVYQIYKKGPVDNLLSQLGLPAYGIQSPIYKIGE